MSDTHSDLELMLATQVAYLDMDEGESVGDRVNYILAKCEGRSDLSSYEEKQLEVAENILRICDQAEDNGASQVDWRSWVVVDKCDDQNGTGYYGCLIDTGDGNAVIGNRGSESYNTDQTVKDWVVADVGLLNSELTEQQSKAAEYANELWQKYSDDYNYFDITGHSLGGNLAEHMAIEMADTMGDKLNRTISFDGPGFSQEYIEAHKDKIASAADKMEHIQWSWVSSLLYSLPGVEDKVVSATDDPKELNSGSSFIDNVYEYITGQLVRHDTHNVIFDENGNVIEGDASDLSKVLGPLSRDFSEELEKYGIDTNIIVYELEKVKVTWDTSKLLFVIEYPVISIVGLLVGLNVIVFKEFMKVAENVKNIISNIYYNYWLDEAALKIVYENLSSSLDTINTLKGSIESARSEIESLKGKLQYDSLSGSYYKSSLAIQIAGLNSDLRKLEKLVSVAQGAITSYSNADNKVETLFG